MKEICMYVQYTVQCFKKLFLPYEYMNIVVNYGQMAAHFVYTLSCLRKMNGNKKYIHNRCFDLDGMYFKERCWSHNSKPFKASIIYNNPFFSPYKMCHCHLIKPSIFRKKFQGHRDTVWKYEMRSKKKHKYDSLIRNFLIFYYECGNRNVQ